MNSNLIVPKGYHNFAISATVMLLPKYKPSQELNFHFIGLTLIELTLDYVELTQGKI